MEDKSISFEEAMEKLDGAIRALEGGSLGLDAAMQTYEQAVKLLRFCHTTLESAERRVSVLLEGEDGGLVEAPFDTADET
ncbi:MAG: exodeoxyribonuclease VII small subunit [Clostridia bacterium]|nr:exodeoxyribonuclease VII small subunit [Clostridia bacterium]